MNNKTNIIQIKQDIFFLFLLELRRFLSKKLSFQAELPKTIGELVKMSDISSGDVVKPFKMGIYKNKTNKKYIVKSWQGINYTHDYYSLKYEARIYTLFNKYLNVFDSKKVKIPKLLKTIDEKNSFMMINEYLPYKMLCEKNSSEKVDKFIEIINFLQAASGRLSENDRRSIPIRSRKDYLFLYPIVLIVSMLRGNTSPVSLIRGVPLVLGSLFSKSFESNTLVHRDLHSQNVLINEQQIYLIDLQRMVLTNSMYEFLPLLAAEWDDQKLRESILKHIFTEYKDKASFFRGLLIFYTTHMLVANNLPNRHIRRYRELLSFGLNNYVEMSKKYDTL